ncbi:MAG TPA: hypothetical protein VFD58_29995 [Blastocatellia bacterium]|nr:hypothetical protein [Blastocatellia bacterium]
MKNFIRLFSASCLLMLAGSLPVTAAQAQKRSIEIFIDVRENNLDKPSTVAINTLTDRLRDAGFRVATRRKDANVVIEGNIISRLTPVTDDVQKNGGVNAEATASLRLLTGGDVIAASVVRSAPGDWGTSADRVGEDRLIEVAGRAAEDLLDGNFISEVKGPDQGAEAHPETSASANRPKTKPASVGSKPAASRAHAGPKKGVSFLEVVSLLQNYVPEDRIAGAVKKYGIKFKPRDAALAQLRSAGATEVVLNAIKSSTVVS